MVDLLRAASSVFYNQDQEEDQKCQRNEHKKEEKQD
jgi:hypothetical protein